MPRRPLARFRPVAAALAVAGVLLLPRESAAQLGDAAAIRRAASEAAERSRLLAERAGPGFQARVRDTIRRSCASRGVTRLDELLPAAVETDAKPGPGSPLLLLDLRAPLPASTPPAPTPSPSAAPFPPDPAPPTGTGPPPLPDLGPDLARVDADTEATPTPRGLELGRGQVRTTRPLGLPRDAIGTIEVDVASDAPGQLLLGWSDSPDAPRLRRNNARVEIVGDGRRRTYAIDAARALQRGLAAGASVQRFFLSTRGGPPLRIEAVRVLPRAHRYGGSAFGTAHESRGGQLRSVLYLHPATTLAFDVDVPAGNPVFEAGLGVLTDDGVMEFEVVAGDGTTRAVLMKRLVRSGPWEDVALDLGALAGRRVRITLAVRGTRDAVAMWSSPLVRPRLPDDRTEPFVVLLEDALRADRLALYGGPVASPGHERVAAAGVTFERAFAQATQTRSSVPSLMTSLLPSTTGTWDFSDSLPDGFVTLAEALRACGFATASFLQNGNAGAYAGLAQGFDVVFDEESTGPRTEDLVGPGSALQQWIAAQRGRPYFAYVHALDPHGPWDPDPRPDLAGALAGDALLRDRTLDAAWLEKPTADARRALYDAEVASNDRALSGLLDRLEASGDLSRAVLAVIADHGEYLGEHGGMWRHHPPAHVEVARVPFLLRAPGAAASRVSRPVALLDLMPTLLDLAHADASALVMQGSSLAATLRGKPAPDRAIPADEMERVAGERSARGCGSFATGDAVWLLSCTRDEDYSPGRLLPAPSTGPAPLRRIGLGAADYGKEEAPGSWSGALVEGIARRGLVEQQAAGINAWRHVSGSDPASIVTEPGLAERLRSLGYAE